MWWSLPPPPAPNLAETTKAKEVTTPLSAIACTPGVAPVFDIFFQLFPKQVGPHPQGAVCTFSNEV